MKMKTKKRIITLGIIVLFFTSCVPSLHPLYNDNDRIEVAELEGKWISDEEVIWEFTKVEDEPTYILRYTDDEQKGEQSLKPETAIFEANIVKLGGHYFMDLYPGENKSLDNMNELLAIHLLAAHTFAKLEIIDGQPNIYFMDPQWLEKLFKENKIRIKHEIVVDKANVSAPDDVFGKFMIHENIILTASTNELQKFISKYANDEKAFLDADVLSPFKQ